MLSTQSVPGEATGEDNRGTSKLGPALKAFETHKRSVLRAASAIAATIVVQGVHPWPGRDQPYCQRRSIPRHMRAWVGWMLKATQRNFWTFLPPSLVNLWVFHSPPLPLYYFPLAKNAPCDDYTISDKDSNLTYNVFPHVLRCSLGYTQQKTVGPMSSGRKRRFRNNQDFKARVAKGIPVKLVGVGEGDVLRTPQRPLFQGSE